MKRPFTRLEKKQLLIFALIAFGIPYLMGIPMRSDINGELLWIFLQMPDVLSGCRSHCRLSSDKNRVSDAPAVFLWVPCTNCTVCHQLCTQCTYTGCQPVGYGHQYAHNCRQSGSLGFVSS